MIDKMSWQNIYVTLLKIQGTTCDIVDECDTIEHQIHQAIQAIQTSDSALDRARIAIEAYKSLASQTDINNYVNLNLDQQYNLTALLPDVDDIMTIYTALIVLGWDAKPLLSSERKTVELRNDNRTVAIHKSLKHLDLNMREVGSIIQSTTSSTVNVLLSPNPVNLFLLIFDLARAVKGHLDESLAERETYILWGMIDAGGIEKFVSVQDIVRNTNSRLPADWNNSVSQDGVLPVLRILRDLGIVDKEFADEKRWKIFEKIEFIS
ncbi:MAG: hypothetical protein Phog2KO_39260 [Phototrophicaceae bacterium]